MLFAALWLRQQRSQRRLDVEMRRRTADADAEVAALRDRLAEAARRERLIAEEAEHLAENRLPAMAKALRHPHVRVPAARYPELLDGPGGKAFELVLAGVSSAVLGERRRVDGAAQAAMRGATTKLQTMCYQLQTTVDDMLHKYDDPELAEKLAGLDYLNEQILRRLQVTRVVCGAGAGLVRTASPLRALVMGASSRIPSYERVQIVDHLPEPVAVADRAAEPVAIVIAELMANAVHHSHGSLPVEVSLHQAHNGAVVVINDAGIGMNADEFGRARRLLSGKEDIHLAELGDPPRSGFAAIGEMCRQYGVAVSVEPSHYAGVKAVVFIPSELLTPVTEEPPIPAPVSRPAPVGPAVAPAPAAAEDDPPALPQRRNRRASDPAPAASGGVGGPANRAFRDPDEAAARMGALQRGTARGRAAEPGSAPEHDSERDSR
ncbi:ATP-binding protein [Streptomyces sp. MP131-18]|uniref:ATP-binding protein n=1 Tax=Streptomyces sp. MP131-18 TaxID=1857892 RepID=UPI001180C89B|nr:ATP-binding protein [Streptomyces sp. MP131-18]